MDQNKKTGLPGFPNPGMLIRQYREKMTYEDESGVIRHWTQQHLADVLGVAVLTVRLMETQCKGLNSMKRRRFIADVLGIPPVIFGLSSLDDLSAYLHGQTSVQPAVQPAVARKATTTALFDDALNIYWDAHHMGYANANVSTIQKWIASIQQETSGELQQTLLCEWFLLLAHMYADQRQFGDAFSVLDKALKMARANEDKEIEAVILYRISHVHLDDHAFGLANDALSAARSLVKYVNKPLLGAISQTSGLALALTAQTESDRTLSQKFLANAASLTGTKEYDPYHVSFGYGRYLLELGDTQIALKRPEAALDTLEEADILIGLDQQKRKGYISILRAEALTDLKQPRWDIATDQLMQAFDLSTKAQSAYNIDYIGRISQRIQKSPYANATCAVQLRMSMHQAQQV